MSASRNTGRRDDGDGDEIQGSDAEEPEQPALPRFPVGHRHVAVRQRNKPGCPRDLIEDFDGMEEGQEEIQEHDLVPLRPLATTKSVGGDEGMISDSEQSTTELDDQFDMLFPPTPDRWKRRRVSVGPDGPLSVEQSHRSYPRTDPISSGSDEPSSPSGARDQRSSPLPDSPPTPYGRSPAFRIEPPRPPSTNSRTPFGDHLRFHFSPASRLTPERFSSTSILKDGTPVSPPQPRKKRNFVVPRSPSATHADQDLEIPQLAPFSPSSDSRRRGRSRASAQIGRAHV